MIKKYYQTGSVAVYFITGVVLVFGLIGSVYLLNQRAEQVRKNKTNISSSEPKKDTKIDKSEDSNQIDSVNTSETNTPGTSQDLPNTGSNFSISELLIIFIITVIIAKYIISRHKLYYRL